MGPDGRPRWNPMPEGTDHAQPVASPSSYRPLSLADTARRIRGGEDPWLAIREFLDDFYHFEHRDVRRGAIAARPEPCGDARFDAYLAALAEYLAMRHRLPVPDWVYDDDRFLETWWFSTGCPSLHATALQQSPAAFRRRGIFVDRTEFSRC